MRQFVVPVLLLTAVALSSSNVLPILSINQLESETIARDGQQNDNIFSNRASPKDLIKNIFYTVPSQNRLFTKTAKHNRNTDQADEGLASINNYNGEGFRKEQWHNYPRQLDRLQRFLFESHRNIKRIPETDDIDHPEGNEYSDATSDKLDDILTNEYFLHSNGQHNIYDAIVAANNPLLILKIHLACLNSGVQHSTTNTEDAFQTEPKILNDNSDEPEKIFTNEVNPTTTIVKREGSTSDENENSEYNTGSRKNKRIFSLWSRLQNLSHKGHELPHRRHLAFYGFPNEESSGSGTLNAPQTRATFVRPPGSPLRWG